MHYIADAFLKWQIKKTRNDKFLQQILPLDWLLNKQCLAKLDVQWHLAEDDPRRVYTPNLLHVWAFKQLRQVAQKDSAMLLKCVGIIVMLKI